MPRIAFVGTALPPHALSQKDARGFLERVYAGHDDLIRLLDILERSGVQKRHFSFPPEYYLEERTFDERNADFIERAGELAAKAVSACLEKARISPQQIDHLCLATTTGLATPSLDALLVNRLNMRRDVRRMPLFGLGCAGGAGALARASDGVKAHPRTRALVVSVELAGQVFSTQALTPVDVVGAALFGEGAAAVLVEGDQTPGKDGVRILASKSVLFEGTEDLMGWIFTSDGARLRLSREVTDLIRAQGAEALKEFMVDCATTTSRIAYWILHPGGRRILEAYKKAFDLNDRHLEFARNSLANVGNLSSASVLFILNDVLDSGRPKASDKGLMCALGPGFAAEFLLLGW